MIAAPSRAPTYLQPRLKAIATSSASSQPAVAKTPISRPSTPTSRQSSARQQLATDPLSDKATAFLIRRTLCSQTADKNAPISDLLPPLTSSNDVDLQLYAFIAIVIREFVYTWYGKITPDQTFVEEVVKIIAHCTRALEQRLRKVDLEALVFDELPELFDAHVKAYRAAYNTIHPPPLEADPRLIYHSLWPTPALFPVPQKNDPASVLIQKENEAVYRQLLVQGVLSVLLPTEDLENDCLTSLVGQIFSEMILGNGVGGKACEPWMMWEGITKIAEVIKSQLPKSKAQERIDKSKSIGGNMDPAHTTAKRLEKTKRRRWSPKRTFWVILQYLFLAFITVRFIIVTIATSSSLPSRLPRSSKRTKTAPLGKHVQPPGSKEENVSSWSGLGHLVVPVKQPILAMKIWTCISTLLDLDVRMPWICATLSMIQWFAVRGPGGLGNTDGMIDKLLSHAILTHALTPSRLPLILRTTRSALFPLNAPAPPRPVPDPAQQLAIKRRCAAALLHLVPAKVQVVYFGDDDDDRRLGEVEDVLDVFADEYMNRHLVYGVVEVLLVRLLPELAEKGVGELMNERLSTL